MKKYKSLSNDNCINTSSDCVTLAVDLPFLELCEGASLTHFMVEIIEKLEDLAGEDLATFDLDELLSLCKLKAPKEVGLLSILTILRDNQICLKDYIDLLESKLNTLLSDSGVEVNLKCYNTFDNFGNSLNITRANLDQLIIDELCNHELRLGAVEGRIVVLTNELANLDVNPIVAEPEFTTCVDSSLKSTSGQVKSIATKVCDIDTELNTDYINTALTRTPQIWEEVSFTGISGWVSSSNPNYGTLSGSYNNLLLAYNKLNEEVRNILATCCAPSCDKITIGFSIIAGDDGDYSIRFRPTDGTNIFDFTDNGSKVSFTGKDIITGEDFTTLIPYNIDVTDIDGDSNTYPLGQWFKVGYPITVSLQVKLTNGSLSCEKCVSKIVNITSDCPICEVSVGGVKGGSKSLTITYQY